MVMMLLNAHFLCVFVVICALFWCVCVVLVGLKFVEFALLRAFLRSAKDWFAGMGSA